MNLDTEVRRGYEISSDMKKVWNIQVELVKKVLEVCKKHNLKIWAGYGTLLGTVRDKGYIPWDDDMDLVMFRDDYEKLLKVAGSEFKEPFFFQNAYTEKKYPRGHSQVRYNGTAAILPCDIHTKFNQSIFIDIFVLDAIPKDKLAFTNNAVRAEFLRNLLMMRTYERFSLHPKALARFLLSRAFFACFNYRKIYQKFEEIYSKNNEVEHKDEYSNPAFTLSQVFINIQKKEWYSDTLYMPFEDIQMPVPVGYDKILTNQYGDYMTPVKAPSYHGGVIFDTERPYTEVLKDIKSGKIDIKKYLNE